MKRMKAFLPLTILFLLVLEIPGKLKAQHIQFNWQNCFNGPLYDEAYDITPTGDGYLISGTYTLQKNQPPIPDDQDIWLIKTDLAGNLQWQKFLGGSSQDISVRIFPASDGNFFVVGDALSSNGDISNDPYPDKTNYWIIKVDSIGTIVWDRIVGGNCGDRIWTGTATEDGGIVAMGWSCSGDGDISQYFGMYDMWMVKLDANGEKVWDFTIGTTYLDYGQAIIQTSDGGFLAGGASSNADQPGNIECVPFSDYAEAIVFKLDSNANIQWQHCYGGSDHEGACAFLELDDGYVFGAYANSADGDLTGSGYHGGDDIWIVKIDFTGNIIWQKCYGGSGTDQPCRIFKTANNGLMIFGTTQSFDGDVIGNHGMSPNEPDIWVLRIDSTGNLLWQQCIGGGGNEYLHSGIVQLSDVDYVGTCTTSGGADGDITCGAVYYNYGAWVFSITDTTTYVGIPKLPEISDTFKVYPNPANEYVVFEHQGAQTKHQKQNFIQIVTVLGQVVETLEIREDKTVWVTEGVKPGVYFYKIEGGGYLGKVVIEN
jgi:hypothetical protein